MIAKNYYPLDFCDYFLHRIAQNDPASLFSEQCGQQSRAERRGAGAREADPGEHPAPRPEAPHQGRPQRLELHSGREAQNKSELEQNSLKKI